MIRSPWGAGALLAALVLGAYAPTWRAGYVWDDDFHVTANPALADARGLAALWTTLDATPQFYPMTHTVLWIQHALWGLDPRGYHATSVLLHATSAILLWRILLLLEVSGAWVAAAVFGIHPVHVESVAWITEQKNTLSGVFYLAAALAFFLWTEGRRRGWAHPAAVAVLYLAALLSKTVTATLPVALAIALWWKRGTVERRARSLLAPMLVAGALLASITRHLEKTQIGALGSDWALSLWERAALSGQIVWFYLGKLAWPSNLTFIYPRFTPDASSMASWLYTITVLVLGAAAWGLRFRLGRGPFAAGAFFVVTLFPALSFFDVYPMRYSFVADHFQYLASLGPIVLASAAAARAATRRATDHAATRRIAPVVAAVVIAALAARTFGRCHAYKDEETLWRDTVSRNDGAWIAHNNLGILLARRGRTDEAATHFERAVALRPEHAGALANLGYVQELTGKYAEAAATLARAVAARPDDADARTHLVHVLVRLNRPAEALPHALTAARLRPDDAETLADAGVLLSGSGRADEAIPLLVRAVALRPGFDRAVEALNRARTSALGSSVRYSPAPASRGDGKEAPR